MELGSSLALLACLALRGLVSAGVKEGMCLSAQGREDAGLWEHSVG